MNINHRSETETQLSNYGKQCLTELVEEIFNNVCQHKHIIIHDIYFLMTINDGWRDNIVSYHFI